MLQILLRSTFALVVLVLLAACGDSRDAPKIGISFGVGEAVRWQKEMEFMTERARDLGLVVDARLNKTDKPKTQTQECIEMIDAGIDVLIIVPRDVRRVGEIVRYAKRKNVKVISYGRAVVGESVDLFIGYDCYQIGYSMGQHLAEKMYKGDIIILKGDENDFNTPLIYHGGMNFIQPFVDRGDIRVVLDDFVPGWSPEKAGEMVKQAVAANGNTVDAIFASNDKLAGASVQALKELGVTHKVVITGMDAEVAALQRLVEGTQDVTIFLDLKGMAYTAINEAYNMATRKKVNINSRLDNESTSKIDAFLVNGKVVTRENIDKVIIQPGHVSWETLYGKRKEPFH